MNADQYLINILNREAVDVGPNSPVRNVKSVLTPILNEWAGNLLRGVYPSGSFAKGTANRSGTDIDLFISLSHKTTKTLKEIYESLVSYLQAKGYAPRCQNVSLGVKVNGYNVDLVPAKQHDFFGLNHSLYRRRVGTWTKTNIQTHIHHIIQGNRLLESRTLKLWRNQKGLDFPSFYLELAVINALVGQYPNTLSNNVWEVFQYLRDTFPNARIVDPANTNNIISDDLSVVEKTKIRDEAVRTLAASNWGQIVK